MKSKIFWKFFASFAFVTFLSLLALYFYLIPTLRQFLLHEIEKTSVEKAALIRDKIDTLPPSQWTIENLDLLADRLGSKVHARITLLDKNGTVFGDSDLTIQEVEKIENHLTRPEIQAALHQEYGAEVRYSTTVKEELMYVALKTSQGFVRVALPIQVLQQTVTHVKQSVLVAALVALLLGSGAGLFFSRSFSKNIGQILEATKQISKGDFSIKIFPGTRDELGTLAKEINKMTDSLDRQRQELSNEKNQLKTVLDGMIEGVLVTNYRGEIVLLNPALERMMPIDQSSYGKTILECLRNQKIHDSVDQVLTEATPRRENVAAIIDSNEREFIVHTAPLLEVNGKIGAVSVFHDITELRKLEDVRREFVANVSHELKTPLTSIRGYAETLRGGALKEETSAMRFLKKIEDNAIHLQNLVEDILKLSQIESGRMEFHAESFLLAPFLTDLCHEFEERALKRRISFSQQISESLPLLSVDPKVLRQIIGNLIDNAFQYTQEGGKVEITAKAQEKEIALSVTDSGIGISPENLSRIFERFYRVDKAHTRGNGGTGLGLSIVKHLVQAHGWEIKAESQVAKGSTFTVIIPLLQTKI